MEQHYKMMDTIKTGGFGSVCLAKHVKTGELRAVKKMKTFVSSETAMAEVKLLTMLNRADKDGYIVHFHGAIEDQGIQHLVFDLMISDLHDWVQSSHPKGVPLEPLKVFSIKILGALQFLASHHVVHSDIRPINFLMASGDPASVRLCDFGMARIRPVTGTRVILPRTLSVASYRAPEVILGYPIRNPQSIDMWAVGCLLMDLLFNKSFFLPNPSIYDSVAKGQDVLHQQCAAVGKPPPHMLDRAHDMWFANTLKRAKYYPEYKSCEPLLHILVKQLHKKRSHRRQEVVCLHDFITRFLTMDPDDRVTTTVALTHAFLNRMQEL